MALAGLLLAGATNMPRAAEQAGQPAAEQAGQPAAKPAAELAAQGPAQTAAQAPAHPRMKTYYLVLILRGPQWTPERTPETARIQEGHMANMERLAAEGKLVVAGPIAEEGNLRGIFVFDVATLEEAKALAATDPAVQAGRFVVEIHPWLVQEGVLPAGKPAP